jgi:hypothetical protein
MKQQDDSYQKQGKLVRILVRAVVLTTAIAGGAAHGATYYFPGSFFTSGDSGVQGYDNSLITAQPVGNSTAQTGTVLTGGDLLTAGSTSIQAYCVDLSHNIVIGSNLNYNSFSDTSTTTVAWFNGLYSGANGAANIQSLEYLASSALSLVNNADSSAAFQIAVWDIAFGSGVSGNPFAVQANGANQATVNNDVAQFLALASNSAANNGPISEHLTLLEDDGTNGSAIQNLVTFTPVPLPPSLWGLTGGLVLMGFAGRGRRT